MKRPVFSAPALTVLGVWIGGLAVVPLDAAPLTPAQTEFFEGKIRPIFANHCYKCHSPAEGNKVKGGLALDSRDGWVKGGNSGAAIVPGNPDKSLLITAVRYTDNDLQMPPKGQKLSTSQIADLEAWVKMGAPDPRTGVQVARSGSWSYGGDHWSFQPIRNPAEPQVQDKSWVATPVDAFVLAKLEAKGLKPSPPADKRSLLRRATFDLIGLPPTPEEVEAFLADKSPDAFAKVVDRLLASKHYGERWGRFWLDTARYSDTKGDVNKRKDEPYYPYAWAYRDYVINSFNADKPFDRFLMEQIAADKLPLGEDKGALAGLGFLTLGDRFGGNINDIINDRIDVLTKGTLALTVACARCHDHKFDPIPQADYYSLHGIFASSMEPKDEPLIEKPANTAEYREYEKEKRQLEDDLQGFIQKNINSEMTEFLGKASAYLLAASAEGNQKAAIMKNNKLNRDTMRQWQAVLNRGRRKNDPVFWPWFAFSRLPEKNFAAQARALAIKVFQNDDKSRPANPRLAYAFRGAAPRSMTDVAVIYGNVFAQANQMWQATLAAYARRRETSTTPGPIPTQLSDVYMEMIREVPFASVSGKNVDRDEALLRFLPRRAQGGVIQRQGRIAELEMTHPGAPARAMVLLDKPNPADSRIFIRGEVGNLGAVAPREFLEVLSGPNRQPYKIGSGRLELAKNIASRDNPLTARVMVNRIWQHHFGEGFVTTPDDFGKQSAPPSHPELLDWLATYFMDHGWSIKKMHRLIMLSNVYQQGSEENPRYAQVDPNNRLLWRANIRRLEFEALRDSILYIGGKLDLTMGGKPVDITAGSYRRTVYARVDRADLPEIFNHFDFANPEITTGKRYETIVPQQALFLMNSPLVYEQVHNVVERHDFKSLSSDEARIQFLYGLIYQRPPSDMETKLGLAFIAETPAQDSAPMIARQVAGKPAPVKGKKGARKGMARPEQASLVAANHKPLGAWEKYAHALLEANEATFVN